MVDGPRLESRPPVSCLLARPSPPLEPSAKVNDEKKCSMRLTGCWKAPETFFSLAKSSQSRPANTEQKSPKSTQWTRTARTIDLLSRTHGEIVRRSEIIKKSNLPYSELRKSLPAIGYLSHFPIPCPAHSTATIRLRNATERYISSSRSEHIRFGIQRLHRSTCLWMRWLRHDGLREISRISHSFLRHVWKGSRWQTWSSSVETVRSDHVLSHGDLSNLSPMQLSSTSAGRDREWTNIPAQVSRWYEQSRGLHLSLSLSTRSLSVQSISSSCPPTKQRGTRCSTVMRTESQGDQSSVSRQDLGEIHRDGRTETFTISPRETRTVWTCQRKSIRRLLK